MATDSVHLPKKSFTPRGYQTEVFEAARERNTIAVLGTGTGKTMIAVMLIRHVCKSVREDGGRVLVVFLAPTVDLVHQQYEVIRDHTEFEVAKYYGDRGVDEWSSSCWHREIKNTEIMVMTPQIILDALRHGFMALDMVHLLIFDECHHANGSHPYMSIMKGFFHKAVRRPAIFGMTASPVITKGSVSSIRDCERQISELQSNLDSKIYMVKNIGEVEMYAPSAKEIHIYYDHNTFQFDFLKNKLETICSEIDASLAVLQESPSNQFEDTNDMLITCRQNLASFHGKILFCLEHLGLICASEAAKVCIENVGDLHASAECDLLISYLRQAYHAIEETLPRDLQGHINTGCGYVEGTKTGYISPKLDALIQIFQSFRSSNQLLCIVFVERIITAKVIERFMNKIDSFSQLSISYMTGGNSSRDALTPKRRRTTLDMFLAGKVNLMLATDVAEEGIHVPNCSYVIRFDLPKSVRSYVQSRGRARQNDSCYVLMLERGNVEHRDRLYDIIRSEFFVKSFSDTDITTRLFKVCCEENAYSVESTGAIVTLHSSVSLIYKYCEKLPKDSFFIPQPAFEVHMKGGVYECILTLPPNAAFQRLVGPKGKNAQEAKQLASLEACKKLHQLGALSDHLLPFHEEPLKTDITGSDMKYAYMAGTTKRKELHGMPSVRALSGTWAHGPDDVTLNAYKIKFTCEHEGENYSEFVLLVEASLVDDVACTEIELFLIPDKMVQASVSPCGKVQLTADQVEKSKLFQEFFFNGIFGRLFVGSRSSDIQREFLFREGKKIPWSSMNMYLLLPLEPSPLVSHNTLCIHWNGIDACVPIVQFLRIIYSPDGQCFPKGATACISSSHQNECEISDDIHLANKSLPAQSVRDSVVLAIHTGRLYSVLDVMYNITPESPFDEICDANQSQFSSFIDYYQQKYNILLQHPRQPLLLLKQSHKPHNLLFSKSKLEDDLTGEKTLIEKKQVHSHIPPELLIHIDISTDILKSFYLLPSVMHRLESLMLASQLQDEVGFEHKTSRISSHLILEAISTSRCCEKFSLERLELLGDSVLKYAVSCHLFLKYPRKHEGQLSDRRSAAVCNSTLHKLGTGRSLQCYIRDSPFDPRRWVAPGQISVRPFPCNCGVVTPQVPLEITYMTEDPSVIVGKACDKGHRWMCSKTISDCVEALIGAYYVGGGFTAALLLMKWFGFDLNFETELVEAAKLLASQLCYLPKANVIEMLESKLDYRFSVKGLLLEAITHPSQQESGIGYCYQRLEFLGDAALDLVITRHLCMEHTNIDPGELTDLRSASVNNENFAQAAVRHGLEHYLQHGSGLLLQKIKEYRDYLSLYQGDEKFLLVYGLSQGPKVLGDMVESITGAILIDTRLNIDVVWAVLKRLLSPIITPDKLALPPLRELIELCSYLGYFIQTNCTTHGKEVIAELSVQLKDDHLIGHGCDKNRKRAKAKAAFCLLKDLEKRGFSHAQCVSRRKQCESWFHNDSLHSDLNISISASPNEPEDKRIDSLNKQLEEVSCHLKPSTVDNCLMMISNSDLQESDLNISIFASPNEPKDKRTNSLNKQLEEVSSHLKPSTVDNCLMMISNSDLQEPDLNISIFASPNEPKDKRTNSLNKQLEEVSSHLKPSTVDNCLMMISNSDLQEPDLNISISASPNVPEDKRTNSLNKQLEEVSCHLKSPTVDNCLMTLRNSDLQEPDLNISISASPNEPEDKRTNSLNKQLEEVSCHLKPSTVDNCSMMISYSDLQEPVKIQKGLRSALFELCKRHLWPMPKFESTEQKFRTPIILNGVKTRNFNIFTTHIKLYIPNYGPIELVGEPKTDKKSSQDAAALVMLQELQKQGRCIIKEQ